MRATSTASGRLSRLRAALLWAAVSVVGRGTAAGTDIDARDHGALGDGKTRDTGAIQSAIRAATERGGGTVRLGPGTYLSGTLSLENDVTLHLESGATLLGSTDIADFQRRKPAFRSYTENYVETSLIHAEKRRNVAVVGRGTIDGQGAAYAGKPYRERPYLLRFVSCEDVRVEDIFLRDSPMWVQHYLDCDRVTIRGVSVRSHVNANNDMIDVDSCRNVRISDCLGDTGDDAITLKSTGSRPCENVVITNCAVFSSCNGIKLGTESNGGFRDIAISNCVLAPPRDGKARFSERMIAGIALETVDGGTLERVVISNIAMTAVRVPIFLRLGGRARPIHPGAERPGPGAFRDVSISRVVAEAVEPIACSITGLPGQPIRDVSLSDVRLVFPGGGTAEDAAREVPEKPEAYPEATMFGTLPAWGLYCRHVEGLTLDGVRIEARAPDARPAIACDDVRRLEIAGLAARGPAWSAPVIVLRDVRDALIRGSIAPVGAASFVRILGDSRGIALLGNDLGGAARSVEFEPGSIAPEEAVHEAGNRPPRAAGE